MKIYRLIRLGFDSLENHLAEARTSTLLGTFLTRGALEARLREEEHIHYLGWDNEIYPQYRCEEEEAK